MARNRLSGGHQNPATTLARIPRAFLVAALALYLAACTAAPAELPPSAATATPGPTREVTSTLSPSVSSAPQPTVRPSPATAAQVVEAPDGILPPASIAVVTADGVRVRDGRPGTPEHADVIYTLNAGDLVFLASQNSASGSMFGYVGRDTSADGRGWYEVHVGGSGPSTWIDGGITGWIAEGEGGLEYLDVVPVTCPTEVDLERVIFRLGETPDSDEWMTAWDRLACFGGRELTLTGVWEHLCYEGTMTPYQFEPSHIAVPFDCLGLILDDIDEAGNTRRAGALPLRMREELFANAPVRGDIVTVRGHFDDPLAATCEATGPDGTAGMIDLRFLVLYCREQFVVEEITVVGHRDLAPAWWEQPSDD